MLENHVANRDILKQINQSDRIALIYHVERSESNTCREWLAMSDVVLEKYSGKWVYGVEVDPVSREGLHINEINIYEFSAVEGAEAFFSETKTNLTQCVTNVTVLAVCPESKAKMLLVRLISKLLSTVKGIRDPENPPSTWKPNNNRVWPDEQQMSVARKQVMNEPILVYNLNKNKEIAQYDDKQADTPLCSGAEAYERYSKAAGPLLLRRGAYPVYGGKPLGVLYGAKNMLYDDWDKFILVYYPQRRNLLSMIESEEYQASQYHRDAGLDRVAIFIGRNKL